MKNKALTYLFVIGILVSNLSFAQIITPNDFKKGTDSERIESAISSALKNGSNSIEIPRMNKARQEPLWIIDKAIVLPSDFTLILRDCLVRLAPGTKDNIITNSGTRQQPIKGNQNINILGIGNAVLSGGLEANWEKPGDKNGYKTIGILLCNTQHFIIQGIKMEETQTWAISVENGCAFGRIANIEFANSNKYPNQDGIDIRKGCNNIIIENITGTTGDDCIALTGLRNDGSKPDFGMQVGGDGITENDDIYNITINNIKAKVAGGHHIVRLLNHDGIKMYNIFISNVMDISMPNEKRCKAAVKIGDTNYSSIAHNKLGETSNIFIHNVLSRAEYVVKIQGTLKDAVITNIAGFDSVTSLVDYGTEPTEGINVEAYKFK